MEPKFQFLMFFKLLILCISFCDGGRPLLDSAKSDNPPNIQPIFPFSPEFTTVNAGPHYHEPERKSEAEPELDSYALPPASEPSWQPDTTNAGKWLPIPVPFFPVPGIPPNPFFPPFPLQGTPVIPPGVPFVSPHTGLQQLRGWAEISNPSQPRMPVGSFFRAHITDENS